MELDYTRQCSMASFTKSRTIFIVFERIVEISFERAEESKPARLKPKHAAPHRSFPTDFGRGRIVVGQSLEKPVFHPPGEVAGEGDAGEPQEGVSGIPGSGVVDSAEAKKTLGASGCCAKCGDGSEPGVGFGFCARCGGEREEVPRVERDRRVHAGMSGFGSGHEFCEPASDAGVGSDRCRTRSAGSDSLRQRSGIYVAAFSGVRGGTADRVWAHRPGAAGAERGCGKLPREAAG